METVLSRMAAARRVMARTFRVRIVPVFIALMWLNLRLAVSVFTALDPLFFPRLRRTQVKAPIVLVGQPRSGTTFLQRFLCDQGYGAGLEVWRMLYASLTIQFFLKPILPILEIVAPTRWHKTKAHDTSLTSVETDDAGVLLRNFDGFFLYAFFLAFDDQDHLQGFIPEHRDTSERDFAWLNEIWRRSLVAHGSDTVIAKVFSLSIRLPQFLRRHPDARILYMARDPRSTIPSGMSLVTGVLENAFGFWKLPPEVKRRWFQRLYHGLVELHTRFAADWEDGRIDKSRVFVVRYDRMMSDFERLMDEMNQFLGVVPTEAQRKAIAEQGEKQRSYHSEHAYNLAKFELDEDAIRRDCARFYEVFLPPLESAAQPSPAQA
ncbi:MAG: sulfotransferase [Polyangiaceae bacterium]|nr:sulfotransferase [Polyangiaceae bacterium]